MPALGVISCQGSPSLRQKLRDTHTKLVRVSRIGNGGQLETETYS